MISAALRVSGSSVDSGSGIDRRKVGQRASSKETEALTLSLVVSEEIGCGQLQETVGQSSMPLISGSSRS